MTSEDVIVATVPRRHPFGVTELPLIGRLAQAAYTKRRRASKRLVGRPAKAVFRFAHRTLGLTGRGRMTWRGPTGEVEIGFNARNTQFRALYLPQEADGYEPETTALLDRLLEVDETFLDVGANWGFFTLFAASRPDYRGAVHAFEPIGESFDDLTDVVRQSGLGDRVRCHRLALSDQGGEATMVIPDALSSGIARMGEGGDIAVPRARLDDLGLPPPGVVKIDVEGHEDRVVAGAAATLKAARPFVVFENWRETASPETTLAPFRALAALGYRFFLPTWWRDTPSGGHAVGVAGGRETSPFALVPFTPEQRFLLPEQFNALACPGDRVDDLRRRVQGG